MLRPLSIAALALAAVAPAVAAQDAALLRPAEIRLGACSSAGEVVAPLNGIAAPVGDQYGQPDALAVEQSSTVIPVLLPDLLYSPHTVVVYASPQESTLPAACGDIGGAYGSGGTLAVGLLALNGSKLDGVAYFAPVPTGDATMVTLLLTSDQSDRARPAPEDPPDASGGATAGEDGVSGASGQDGANGQDGADGQDGQPGQGGRGSDGRAGGKGGKGGDGGDGGNGGDAQGGRGGDGGDGGAGADATSTSG